MRNVTDYFTVLISFSCLFEDSVVGLHIIIGVLLCGIGNKAESVWLKNEEMDRQTRWRELMVDRQYFFHIL